MSNATKWIKLIAWIIIFEMIGMLMGILTQNNFNWYDGLMKSALTPPGYVFSIVWSILYLMLAVIGWALYQHPKSRVSERIIYFLQLAINFAWTPLFFQWHMIGLSFIAIISMIFLNIILIVKLTVQKKWVAYSLIPYLMWLLFAAYLNGFIWFNN